MTSSVSSQGPEGLRGRPAPSVHVEVRELEAGYAAWAAVRLEGVGIRDAEAEREGQRLGRMLSAQVDFIASLPGLGAGSAVELRHMVQPCVEARHRGRIEVSLRLRVEAASRAEARRRAEAAFPGFLATLVAMDPGYDWVPVTEAAEYRWRFDGDAFPHGAELVRREARIRLSALDLLPRNRALGFAADPGQNRYDTVDLVHVVAPFLESGSNLERLYDLLLLQPSPVLLSVWLEPTALRQGELQHLFDQVGLCEAYLHGETPRALPLVHQVKRLCTQLTETIFALRDDCFGMRIVVAGQEPLSPTLVEAIGTTVTAPVCSRDLHATGEGPRLMSGGYDWGLPGPESRCAQYWRLPDEDPARAQLRAMLAGAMFWEEGPCPEGRLRHLFSAREAGCGFRFPVPTTDSFPGLPLRRSVVLPMPSTAPMEGLLLGENVHRGMRHDVRMLEDDRRRHTYIVGQTGTGKSTLLRSMILDDLEAGRGVAVIDPHGELVDDLLGAIPESRLDDVIYVNPERDDIAIGINMLDHRNPMERDLVINQLLEIFYRLYHAIPDSMGPAFEQYFRNAVLLEMVRKEPTLDGVLRIFAEPAYRNALLEHCTDPLISGFWKLAQQVTGEASMAGMGQYVANKLNRFLYNVTLRRILLQPKTTIDFEEVLNGRKILLVDLCKGLLGEMNAAFLAMAILGQIQRAAFARTAEWDKSTLSDFYLYIDEFQNVATDSFITILSEARKYRLNAILSNQYMNQIPRDILAAVRGNVGTVIAYRTGIQDAELLQEEFAPAVRKDDLLNLPNFHSYVSTLIQGEAVPPFSMRNKPRPKVEDEAILERNARRICEGMRATSTAIAEVDAFIQSRWGRREEPKPTASAIPEI